MLCGLFGWVGRLKKPAKMFRYAYVNYMYFQFTNCFNGFFVQFHFQDALAQSTHIAEEKISNIRTVKSFGKEDTEMQRYDIEMKNVLDKTLKEALVQAKFYGMVCIV